MKCSECRFFQGKPELKGVVNGECRYGPPSSRKPAFPPVSSVVWCGKFKPVAECKPDRPIRASFW